MRREPKRRLLVERGFTLIELSIVLVIIGLIVGGVLVGQDLIRAAEIRATVSQYEKYNAAVNTFRTKYNGIPGDISAQQASAFGLYAISAPTSGVIGSQGNGDGNGLIQDNSVPGTEDAAGEPLAFWRQLSDASLIDASLGANLTTAGVAAADTTAGTVGQYLPAAKLGRGNYWMVAAGANTGHNFFMLTAFGTTPFTAANGLYTLAKGLTPIEAYNVDVKLDDGAPNTGGVQARSSGVGVLEFRELATGLSNAAPFHTFGNEAAGDCTVGPVGSGATDVTATYSRGTLAGTTPGCILRMRFN